MKCMYHFVSCCMSLRMLTSHWSVTLTTTECSDYDVGVPTSVAIFGVYCHVRKRELNIH